MKKLLLLTSLFALLFSACSKDESTEPTEKSMGRALTFTFPGVKGVTTYDTRAIATIDENQLDLSTLRVYMFDANTQKLDKIFSAGDITTIGTATETKITVELEPRNSGLKVFYFLGNGDNGTLSDFLAKDFKPGASNAISESDFLKEVTNLQGASHLTTPLIMTGKSAPIDITTVYSTEVELRRRVVRLDIKNDPAISQISIKQIYILKAASSAYTFRGQIVDRVESSFIDLPVVEDILVNPAQKDLNTGSETTIAYIYPTSLNNTIIRIQDTRNNWYTVKQPNGVAPGLMANTRYIIQLSTITRNQFELTIADWQTEANKPLGTKPLVFRSTVANNTISGGIFDMTPLAAGQSQTFDFSLYTSDAASVVDPVLVFEKLSGADMGSAADVEFAIVSKNTTGPDADGLFKTDFNVKITKKRAFTKDILARVKFINSVDPSLQSLAFSAYEYLPGSNLYPGSNLETVAVGATKWAPLNVGATTTDARVLQEESYGFIYQWGRDYNFSLYGKNKLVAGPVSMADSKGKYADTFIFMSNSDDHLNQGNWLAHADRATNPLWSGVNVQGPCPNGWALPVESQINAIVTAMKAAGATTISNNAAHFNTGSGVLHFPLSGSISRNLGICVDMGMSVTYPSSTTNVNTESNDAAFFLDINVNGTIRKVNYTRTNGTTVRCVKL